MQGFPVARPGQRVGLLGGSFDPAHEGHAHISRLALRRFGLDWVWWLVSPGNPLKPHPPAEMADRIAVARSVMRHPRVHVTDIEAHLGTRFTAATVAALERSYPGVRFVWLMGADNLETLHHWDRWRTILETVPVGVLARPDHQLRAGHSLAARTYATRRLPERAARLLPTAACPAWCLVVGPLVEASSSELRRSGAWPRRRGLQQFETPEG
ncbi:MAG: nicotinate-nucleotide adenylyltransferase [Pseudomonadota bacterium]